VTEGMAQATQPGLYHTAEGAHLEGIDFAGKTGTAQVVAGGDTHNKGGAKTPNAWFVGMVPRRNPEIAVVVLQEHGDWGSGSAKLAAQVITAYVNKKRKQEGNLLLQATQKAKPVEMGAVWSVPEIGKPVGKAAQPSASDVASAGTKMGAGRFVIAMNNQPELSTDGAPLFSRPVNPQAPSKPQAPPAAMQAETGVALPERFREVIR
jgi:membrane peptidoglycan carboxypeptidase